LKCDAGEGCRNEEVLHKVKEENNILYTIKRRKLDSICYILRRNSLLKHISQGKIKGGIKVTARRRRRRKQLLDYLKESTLRAEQINLFSDFG
jgi:hypothetical protein